MCGNCYPTKKIEVIVFLVAFLLTAAFPARAKEIVTLDETVVTATRTREKSFALPTPIETVTSEYLEIANPQSLSQPLRSMPGVDIANSGYWEAYPVIRGLGANRVLVLYDGDRDTNTWAGRAPLTPFLDLGDVARIEVVKGPASVLYGTDALGGVINIITKQPDFAHLEQFTLRSAFATSYTSVNDGRYLSGTLEGGGRGCDFRCNLSARDTHDYDDGGGKRVNNSAIDDYRLDLKVRYLIGDRHEFLCNYRRNKINDMGVPQKVTSTESHFTRYDSDIFKCKYNGYDLGFFREVNLSTWFIDQRRDYAGLFYSGKKPVHMEKGNDIDTWSGGATLQGKLNIPGHKPVIGLEYVYQESESDEHQFYRKNRNDANLKKRLFKPLSDAEREHFGIFFQDGFALGERFRLLAGARYDYFAADADDSPFRTLVYDPSGRHIIKDFTVVQKFDRETDEAFTYNLGVLCKITEKLHLTANAASGFRAPDVFERFSSRGGSFIIIGNPDLDPEYSYNFDSGIKFRSSRVHGTFDFFYNRVNDFIDFVKTGESFAGLPKYRYVNIANAELYGYDGALEFALGADLTLFGNLAYVVGKNRDSDDRLNLIPPLNGRLGFRYKREEKRRAWWFEVNSELYARQRHPGPAETETAGYAVFNFRSGISFSCPFFRKATLNFNIDNLLDKDYARHLNLSTLSSRIDEPGRSFNLSFKAAF